MTDNLIEEIRVSESEAAKLRDEAVRAGEERLVQLRNEIDRENRKLEEEYRLARKEAAQNAVRDASRERDVTGNPFQQDIDKLEAETRGSREKAIQFILDKIFGD